MKKTMKVLAVLAAAAMLAGLTACGGSKAFPNKEISLVVPFGSGGGTDLLARTLAEPAGKSLGKSVVVTNVTGASGTVGSAQIAGAETDGYDVMFVTTAPLAIQPYFMNGLTYNEDSFTYLCNVATEPTCLAVKSDSPYKTVDDLIKAGKSGTVTFGNTGVGTLHYLFQEQFCKAAGIDYKQVGFEGGAKLVTGLLGNNVEVISTVVSEMYNYVQSGEIRILAVSTEERSPLYPDIPTVKESGYDIAMSLDFFMVGPKGIADDAKKKLEESFGKAAQDDSVKKYLENAHIAANYMDGAALEKKVKEDAAMYKSLVAEAK